MSVTSPNLPPNSNWDLTFRPARHDQRPRPNRPILIPTHHHAENRESARPKLDKAGVTPTVAKRLRTSSDWAPRPNHILQSQSLRSLRSQIISTPLQPAPPPNHHHPVPFLSLLLLPSFSRLYTDRNHNSGSSNSKNGWLLSTAINATANPACARGGNISRRRKSPARLTPTPARSRRLPRCPRSTCRRRPVRYSDVR